MLKHDDIGAGARLELLKFFDGNNGVVHCCQNGQGQGDLSGGFRLNAVGMKVFMGTGIVVYIFPGAGLSFPAGIPSSIYR